MPDNLEQDFKVMIINGFKNANYAYEEIFSDRKNESITIGHLSIANSYISSAQAVYICNSILCHPNIDEFFDRFSILSDEVMDNIRTNHSHQWSSIQFRKFEDSYENLASHIGINSL